MALPALCCFLCHGMVQFTGKNPSDFKNHMINQHKALFNVELSLACSLMDEKESQNIIKQHMFMKYKTNMKQEDTVLLTENQIKQEHNVSMEEKTNIDIKTEIWEDEYMEVEDFLVKEETNTQDNSVQKLSPKQQSQSTALSEKSVTHKRLAEELSADYEPKLKKIRELKKCETKQETNIFTRPAIPAITITINNKGTTATNWTPRPGLEREGRSSLVCPSCQEEVVTVSLEEHMDSHGFTPKSLMTCTLCKEESPVSKGLCRNIKTVVPVPDMFEHMKKHFTLISAFWKFPKDNGFVICPVCIVSTSKGKSKTNPKGTSMKINNLAKHMLKIHGQDFSSKMVSGVTAPGCEGCGAKRVRMSEVGLHVRNKNDAQSSQRCEKS